MVPIDYTENDRAIYHHELADFLPGKILDAHVHLLQKSDFPADHTFGPTDMLTKFGCQLTLDDCRLWMDTLLPDQSVSYNTFGFPHLAANRDANAAYIGSLVDNETHFGMALVGSDDSVDTLSHRITDNHLIGLKPYQNLVRTKPIEAVEVNDLLTTDQLALADELGLAITFHIPGKNRMADDKNRAQMVALCRRWKNITFIFAHIGRAYWISNIEGHLAELAHCPNAWFDTSMVNHTDVLTYTFKHFPRERLVFGTDIPISLLKGKSVEINNQYAYLMAENYRIGTAMYDPQSTVTFTFFFYEQLRAIKRSAAAANWSTSDIERYFHTNAYELFKGIHHG